MVKRLSIIIIIVGIALVSGLIFYYGLEAVSQWKGQALEEGDLLYLEGYISGRAAFGDEDEEENIILEGRYRITIHENTIIEKEDGETLDVGALTAGDLVGVWYDPAVPGPAGKPHEIVGTRMIRVLE